MLGVNEVKADLKASCMQGAPGFLEAKGLQLAILLHQNTQLR